MLNSIRRDFSMLPLNKIKNRLIENNKNVYQTKELEEIKDSLYQLAELMIDSYMKDKEKRNSLKV